MRNKGWEMTFSDRESTPEEESARVVHQWMRNWVDIHNRTKKELDVEERNIEEIIAKDDFVAYVDDKKTGQKGKLYTSGIKRNGKIDLAMVFPDGRKTVLKDCEQKPSNDNISSGDISLNFEFDSAKVS